MNVFAYFGLIEFSIQNNDMYDCFLDICEKVLAGDRDAISVVVPIIRNVQMDILREQEHLYISIRDNDAEYEEPFEIFAAYIEDLPEEYYTELIPDHFPRKFANEARDFFKYTDEGKKCMKEFNPNTNKIVEVNKNSIIIFVFKSFVRVLFFNFDNTQIMSQITSALLANLPQNTINHYIN